MGEIKLFAEDMLIIVEIPNESTKKPLWEPRNEFRKAIVCMCLHTHTHFQLMALTWQWDQNIFTNQINNNKINN